MKSERVVRKQKKASLQTKKKNVRYDVDSLETGSGEIRTLFLFLHAAGKTSQHDLKRFDK